MNIFKVLIALMLVSFGSSVFAYGSSSSKKACAKPKFTEFTPPHLSEVTAQSNFSFVASSLTRPKSIVVSVKKRPVDVIINKTNNGYSVKGALPATLQSTYARVNIEATGTNNCKAKDGWLLKIED